MDRTRKWYDVADARPAIVTTWFVTRDGAPSPVAPYCSVGPYSTWESPGVAVVQVIVAVDAATDAADTAEMPGATGAEGVELTVSVGAIGLTS